MLLLQSRVYVYVGSVGVAGHAPQPPSQSRKSVEMNNVKTILNPRIDSSAFHDQQL